MTLTLSNVFNNDIVHEHYDLDYQSALSMFLAASLVDLPTVNQPEQIFIINAERPRNKQSDQLLQRLLDSLIECQYGEWLTKRGAPLNDAFSIDYSRLSYQDTLDLYLRPSDHILDEFGDEPVVGPVFLDVRDHKLRGVCIRNVSKNLRYASAAKFTFSNSGWFLFGLDLYDSNDDVFIVEGVFDALAMRIAGYKAIAIGAASPTPMQLACLKKRYHNLTLCLDNDFWGHHGAYVASTIADIPICHTKLKDAASGTIELIAVDRSALCEQLIEEITEYNINAASPKMIRDLPYN